MFVENCGIIRNAAYICETLNIHSDNTDQEYFTYKLKRDAKKEKTTD